jgi:hypothetical protein
MSESINPVILSVIHHYQYPLNFTHCAIANSHTLQLITACTQSYQSALSSPVSVLPCSRSQLTSCLSDCSLKNQLVSLAQLITSQRELHRRHISQQFFYCHDPDCLSHYFMMNVEEWCLLGCYAVWLV